MYNFKDGIAFAKELDAKNELAKYRDRFYQVENCIYMDGNSLGLASKDVEEGLADVLQVWKNEAIRIWNVDKGRFWDVSRITAQKLAPLLNADPSEIITMGSITSNIHQGMTIFFNPTKEKYKVIVDELNFPSDIYAVKSMIESKGYTVEDALVVIKSRDQQTIDEQDVIDAMTSDVALVWLPSVEYRSGQLLDMELITKEAHKRDIFVGWSLAHSMGSVPHDFKKIDPDFAVWCTYKYLNAGPGANAGMYINKKHHGRKEGLRGWYGNNKATQFAMSHDFDPASDANGWLIGTPNMLSTYPIQFALNVFEQAGMPAIRKESLNMTAYLMFLLDSKLVKYGYSVGGPREDERRGGHVACVHDEAFRIAAALRDNGVIPDFREPNVVRLAPIALYNTYEEIFEVVNILEKIVTEKLYENYSSERNSNGTVV